MVVGVVVNWTCVMCADWCLVMVGYSSGVLVLVFRIVLVFVLLLSLVVIVVLRCGCVS